MSRALPQRIGPYEVLAELGRGGMGVVYRARDPRTGEEVAVKVLLDERGTAIDRFQVEARAASQVRHPNLVPVLDAGTQGGHPYLVMAFVPGESLGARLRRGRLPVAAAVRITRALAEGLAEVHAQGFLHRDVKPENVLLDAQGTPRLTDFGMARTLDRQGLTRTGAALGTPSYMAPEQVDDASRVDPRADVYALGATLYALLTGEPPFKGSSLAGTFKKILQDPAQPPSKLRPELDPELDAIVLRCLDKDPGGRFDAQGLARVLEGYQRRTRAGVPRGAASAAPWVALGVIGLGAALALALVFSSGGGAPQARVSPSPAPSSPPSPPPPAVPTGSPQETRTPSPPPPPPPTEVPDVSPVATPAEESARTRTARRLAALYAARDMDTLGQELQEALRADPREPAWLALACFGDWKRGQPYVQQLRERGLETGLDYKLAAAYLFELDGEQHADVARQSLELLERAWALEPALFAQDDNFFHFYGNAVQKAFPDDPAQRVQRLQWAIRENKASVGANVYWHFCYLASAYQALGDDSSALHALEQARDMNPGYGATWHYLAEQQLRMGRRAEARASWQRCLEISTRELEQLPASAKQARAERETWRKWAEGGLQRLEAKQAAEDPGAPH